MVTKTTVTFGVILNTFPIRIMKNVVPTGFVRHFLSIQLTNVEGEVDATATAQWKDSDNGNLVVPLVKLGKITPGNAISAMVDPLSLNDGDDLEAFCAVNTTVVATVVYYDETAVA